MTTFVPKPFYKIIVIDTLNSDHFIQDKALFGDASVVAGKYEKDTLCICETRLCKVISLVKHVPKAV